MKKSRTVFRDNTVTLTGYYVYIEICGYVCANHSATHATVSHTERDIKRNSHPTHSRYLNTSVFLLNQFTGRTAAACGIFSSALDGIQ